MSIHKKKKKTPMEQQSSKEKDMEWSLWCFLPSTANPTPQSNSNLPNKLTMIEPPKHLSESSNSNSNSLFDDILDELNQDATVDSSVQTTNDGFDAFSRDVMLRRLQEQSCDEETEKKENINNNMDVDMEMNIATTDDGMHKLALDCMKVAANLSSAEESDNDPYVEGVMPIQAAQNDNPDDADDEQEDEEEGKQASHQMANHQMLSQLNDEILRSNITPNFVSPGF